jgi:hypothetical protein
MSHDCVLELAQAVRILNAHKAGEITLDEAAKALGRLHSVAKRDTTSDGKLCLDDYYVVFYGHFVNKHGKVQPKNLVVFKTLEKAESWWKLYGDGERPCPPYKIARALLLELVELCMKHRMEVMVEGLEQLHLQN